MAGHNESGTHSSGKGILGAEVSARGGKKQRELTREAGYAIYLPKGLFGGYREMLLILKLGQRIKNKNSLCN